jgi:hypothetical protein
MSRLTICLLPDVLDDHVRDLLGYVLSHALGRVLGHGRLS